MTSFAGIQVLQLYYIRQRCIYSFQYTLLFKIVPNFGRFQLLAFIAFLRQQCRRKSRGGAACVNGRRADVICARLAPRPQWSRRQPCPCLYVEGYSVSSPFEAFISKENSRSTLSSTSGLAISDDRCSIEQTACERNKF